MTSKKGNAPREGMTFFLERFSLRHTVFFCAYNGIDEALCPVLKPIKGENTND